MQIYANANSRRDNSTTAISRGFRAPASPYGRLFRGEKSATLSETGSRGFLFIITFRERSLKREKEKEREEKRNEEVLSSRCVVPLHVPPSLNKKTNRCNRFLEPLARDMSSSRRKSRVRRRSLRTTDDDDDDADVDVVLREYGSVKLSEAGGETTAWRT